MALYDIPYSIGFYFGISVDDDIPCANDLTPWDVRRQISGTLVQLPRSLANDLDVSLDGGLQILVPEKTGEVDARCRPLNRTMRFAMCFR